MPLFLIPAVSIITYSSFSYVNGVSTASLVVPATLLTMDFTGFPYLAIWSKPNAPFICIEPWYSIADNIKSSGVFTQKPDIISLKPGDTFECKYTVEFF